MESLVFHPEQPINIERLDEDLRAALGQQFYGLSYHHRELVVHVADAREGAPISRIEALLQAHNPDSLSHEQAQLHHLHTLRQAQTPLEQGDTLDAETLLPQLVEKVAWLEAELRRLLNL